MPKPLARLAADTRGATTIEYGVLIVMISIVGIATLNALGSSAANLFSAGEAGVTAAAQGLHKVPGDKAMEIRITVADPEKCWPKFLSNYFKNCS